MNLDKLFETETSKPTDEEIQDLKGEAITAILKSCKPRKRSKPKNDETDEERKERLYIKRVDTFLNKFRALHRTLLIYAMMGADEKDIQNKRDEIKKLLDDEMNSKWADKRWKKFLRETVEELIS